jgi:hypothetical protein
MLAAGLFALLYQLPVYDRWFSHMDEGHMLLFADIVAQGGQLYRDASLYPLPGAFYFLAGLFWLFDPSIWIARVVAVIEFTLLAGFAWWLTARLTSPRIAVSSLLLMFLYRVWAFPHWHMYSYSSLSLLLLVGAVLLMLRFAERRGRVSLALAGLLAGLAVFVKQDYGAAGGLALTLLLGLAVRNPVDRGSPRPGSAFAIFFAPAVAVGLAAGLHFLQQGLLVEVVRQTVFGHMLGIGAFEYPTVPSLLPLLGQAPALRDGIAALVYAPSIMYTTCWGWWQQTWLYRETVFWELCVRLYFYTPYLLSTFGAVRLWQERRAPRSEAQQAAHLCECALYALGVLLLAAFTLNRPHDSAHLGILYFPWVPLAPLYLKEGWGALSSLRRRTRRVVLGCGLAAALLFTGFSGALFWLLRAEHDVALAMPRAGIYAKDHEVRMLEGLVAYIQERTDPDETVGVLPYFPILPFLADRPGPHRSSYVVWPVADIPDRDAVLSAAMEQQQTRVVIYNFTQFIQLTLMDEYAPGLFRYLVDHFEIDRVFSEDYGGYMLAALRREQQKPRGRRLLGEEGADPVVRILAPFTGHRTLRGEERAAYYALEAWPFRDVAVLRPSSVDNRSALSVELEVPPAAVLETAIGVHQRMWFDYPGSWVEFEISVIRNGHGEPLFSKRLDPHRVLSDRGWFEVTVPLAAYSGQRVVLEFSTRCERPRAESRWMAAWEVPRILSGTEAEAGPVTQ